MNKNEEISRVRYFYKKEWEVCHMATPQQPWAPISRGAPLPSYYRSWLRDVK